MKKFNGRLATIALGIAALCGSSFAAQAATVAPGNARMIIAFKDGKGALARAAIAKAGGRVLLELDELNAVAVELPAKAAAALKANAAVKFVEADPIRKVSATSEPSTGNPYQLGQQVPYGIKLVQADQLSDASAGSRKVCIIDSGFDGTHEDLVGIPIAGENLSGSGEWNTDELGHGSHVLGTIAAVNNGLGVVGVMPNKKVNIQIEKVFDASGSAASSVITKAMLRCGVAKSNVVSMSLGGSSASKLEQAAVNWLEKKGTLVVAAAGNAGTTAISYPGGFDTVMAVGALDENKQWASFSQYNATVDIAGPGVSVLSSVPMGTGLDASATVAGTAYSVLPMTGSPVKSATAALANFGLGDKVDTSVAGKICLIQRGSISFADKVLNCQTSGGVGAIVYNNEAGPLNGTLGETVTTIPSVGASMADGQTLTGKIGSSTTVALKATNYALYDGTSMATPHVSAVAALVWSYFPKCTAAQMRSSLELSAMDLGDAGRDDKYGYGLVQAKAAYDRIASKGCGL